MILDPSDPRFWDKPVDWHKYTKWQRLRWYLGKIGIAITERFGP
jgi:hypothetical protein